MSMIKKVEDSQSLQNLVTYIILTAGKPYCVHEFVDQIMGSPYFNNFCDKKEVVDITEDTLMAFLRSGYVHCLHSSKYYPIPFNYKILS